VERDLKCCPGCKRLGEAQHQPPPAHVLRHSLERGSLWPRGLACNLEGHREADTGMWRHGQGEEQVAEGLGLIRTDPGEDHAVGDGTGRRGPLSHPDHLGLYFNGAAVRPEAHGKRHLRPKPLGQLDAGAPLAEVAGPAGTHFASGRLLQLVQDRKLNRIPGESAVRPHFGHGLAS